MPVLFYAHFIVCRRTYIYRELVIILPWKFGRVVVIYKYGRFSQEVYGKVV